MLVTEEYESKQTRKILYTAFDRLEHETRRADAAEARIEGTIQRAKAVNEARITAQQETMRAQDELKLYKLQLNNAQNEILRAQDVLKAIEAQRDEAEAVAASARSKARRLKEDRLIESAREEGRRLGFEEGVRRGRHMGYREAYNDDRHDGVRGVADVVVDRLLEERDEPEQIEVLEDPRPIPPPSSSRLAPEVHRLETPVNSSLENERPSSRSRRDSSIGLSRTPSAHRHPMGPVIPLTPTEPRIIPPPGSVSAPSATSRTSRPPSIAQPWAGPLSEPPFTRPPSVQNSPPSVHHSEVRVPPDNYIPTADANHHISLPPPHEMQRNIPSPTPSQRTLGATSERGRGRDYMYDNYSRPGRASPDESITSAKQSAASTISQLDIVGLPTGSRRPQGLSVIHEDASMRSDRMTDYSQTIASTSQAGRNSFREMGSSETLGRDRRSKQQLADELRYSDPTEAEQWRRQSGSSRSQPPPDAPPRHRPSQVTTPTPLSPPRVLQQPDLRHRRSTSERQGRTETRSEYSDQRRPLSSDSSVPEINIEPPSGPPSDAPSRGRGEVPVHGLLSPDHAHHALPIPAPPTSVGRSTPTPNSPVTRQANLAGHFYAVPPNSQHHPGFSSSTNINSSSQVPVIPQSTGGAPYGAPSSERGSDRSRTPISIYATSPVPAGVMYPAPPISRSAGYNANPYPQGVPSNPSSTGKPVQTAGSADSGGGASVRDSGVSRRQSSASLASQQSRPSYSRYNPNMYNDPAYLASNDSLVDSVTGANTAANGGGPVRPVRIHGSPGYSYATLRANE
ncbi:hypothetical protein JVU11DRAFT_2124 [Chiua virens]|nr:hypothetical protein JVU11DRAFT_2124 [Chiua virens]